MKNLQLHHTWTILFHHILQKKSTDPIKIKNNIKQYYFFCIAKLHTQSKIKLISGIKFLMY